MYSTRSNDGPAWTNWVTIHKHIILTLEEAKFIELFDQLEGSQRPISRGKPIHAQYHAQYVEWLSLYQIISVAMKAHIATGTEDANWQQIYLQQPLLIVQYLEEVAPERIRFVMTKPNILCTLVPKKEN